MLSSERYLRQVGRLTLFLRVYSEKEVRGVAVLLGVALLAPIARGQELSPAWFKSEYLPAAAQLEQAYETSHATITETATTTLSPKYSVTKIDFAFDGEQLKFDRTITEHSDGVQSKWSRSIVASPEVSFMVLTKQAGEPLLEQVTRSGLGYSVARKPIQEQACETLFGAFAVLGRPVSSWLKDEEFRIKDISRNDDRVRLTFSSKDAPGEDREYDGWIDFLPSQQWVIDSWEITLTAPEEKTAWRNVAKLNYAADAGGVPRLSDLTMVEHNPTFAVTRKLVVGKLSFAAVEDKAFRLSSYGYDDRIGLPVRLIDSAWLWVVTAGLLCLLAASMLRYRMKTA